MIHGEIFIEIRVWKMHTDSKEAIFRTPCFSEMNSSDGPR
jgi:hypothetical protein